LEKKHKGQYRVVREYQLFIDNIVSIEAKLKNWKRALYQAIRYKQFSNESYVLLDKKNVRPAVKNLFLFKEKNVGLLSMDYDGYTLHYKPHVEDVKKSHSFFRLNEAVFESLKA
jgi:hypothetical protein